MAKWKNEWIDAPIGRPIVNTGAYVMNQSLVPLPPGIEGELCIAGQGLAQGYYNNERLTREKFLFSDYLGLRIYKTGDRAYLAPSGDILIRGRSDRLVKRRGFRIELEEIERALLSLETVKNCVVLQENQKIWAFIVLSGNEEKPLQKIKRELSKHLPEYMLPDKLILCGEFPRLFNGKIDYTELKKIGQRYNNLSSNSNDSEVPTDQESEILDIWENLLGAKVNSVHDNFFDVGGDSLKIIRLHSKLQEYFRVKFNVSILFSHPTCHAQALFLQSLISNKKEKTLPNLNRLELLKELQKGNIDPSHMKELLAKSHRG
jgi:aryl carrier-like protein